MEARREVEPFLCGCLFWQGEVAGRHVDWPRFLSVVHGRLSRILRQTRAIQTNSAASEDTLPLGVYNTFPSVKSRGAILCCMSTPAPQVSKHLRLPKWLPYPNPSFTGHAGFLHELVTIGLYLEHSAALSPLIMQQEGGYYLEYTVQGLRESRCVELQDLAHNLGWAATR